eukprot:CAMPEP_0167758050 /NCGR_PEP_ID=MMETSP0110_2-20121227/10259_1 /TAXON_ID=629695 /ORGANISM="Gymnochlora sp., Strain CCMP2014" /LENGTH=632 /DNA_ID=CAMNT_0007644295 /DNA_START=45 /DNA_END=1940 /DNA_ORIENTATION=-
MPRTNGKKKIASPRRIRKPLAHRNTLKPRWRQMNPSCIGIHAPIVRIYFSYGYAQLALMTKSGSLLRADIGGKTSAYVTIRPPPTSTLKDIQEQLIKALQKRKMEKVTSWVKKFQLVDRKTRNYIRNVRPFLALSGSGNSEDPFELDMVPCDLPINVLESKDLNFEATKYLSYMRRQPRTIRLTSKGIENVKIVNGKEVVSSQHTYAEVFYTALIDRETLVISYTDAKEHKYGSRIAVSIIQHINDRVSAFLRLEKDYLIQQDTQKEAEKVQQRVVTHWRAKTDLNLSKKKIASTLPTKAFVDQVDVDALLKGHRKFSVEAPKPGRAIKDPRVPTVKMSTTLRASANSKSVGTLFDARGSETSSKIKVSPKLYQTLDMILVGNEREGLARNRFIKSFDETTTNCQMIRKFIDSMSAYIKKQRELELGRFLLRVPEEKRDKILNDAIEDSLQRTVINILYPRLVTQLRRQFCALDQKFLENSEAIEGDTQAEFGIDSKHIIPDGWSTAVTKLSMMERYSSPSQKLQVLVSTAHIIYNAFNQHVSSTREKKSEGKRKGQRFLSADSFFPIFVFVLVNSTIKDPHLHKSLMWGLCSKADLQGEGGYYLTVYEAAVTYVTKMSEERRTESTSTTSS